jgi:hypothetical protein
MHSESDRLLDSDAASRVWMMLLLPDNLSWTLLPTYYLEDIITKFPTKDAAHTSYPSSWSCRLIIAGHSSHAPISKENKIKRSTGKVDQQENKNVEPQNTDSPWLSRQSDQRRTPALLTKSSITPILETPGDRFDCEPKMHKRMGFISMLGAIKANNLWIYL